VLTVSCVFGLEVGGSLSGGSLKLQNDVGKTLLGASVLVFIAEGWGGCYRFVGEVSGSGLMGKDVWGS